MSKNNSNPKEQKPKIKTTQAQQPIDKEVTDLVVTGSHLVVVPEDKAATLQALKEVYQKKFGKHVIFLGSQIPEITFRTTGIEALDEITEGGLPVGRLVEFWGDDENGKLSLIYTMMKQYGPHVLYIDAERAANKKLMDALGVHPDIFYSIPETLEDALTMVFEFAEKGMPFIVIDSLPALLPEKERDNKDFSSQAGVSMTANLLSRTIYDLVAKASNSGSIVVLTNQLRDKVGAMRFGEQYKAPGGHALKHACSLVLKMAKIKYLSEKFDGKNSVTYGQETAIQVYQSKVSTPNQDASLFLIYGRGFYDMYQIAAIKKELAAPYKQKTVVTEEEESEKTHARKEK